MAAGRRMLCRHLVVQPRHIRPWQHQEVELLIVAELLLPVTARAKSYSAAMHQVQGEID